MNKTLKLLVGAMIVVALIIPSKLLLNAYNDTSVLKCAGYSVDIKGNSSGLLYGVSRLDIEKPQIIAMDTTQACAVVAWNTSALSTSQVIFAKDGQDKRLDFIDSDETTFWGYPNGSVQNNNPQKYHVMIINNLEKGKKYSLRAVSRFHTTALPSVSEELNFVFEPARIIPQKTFTVFITFKVKKTVKPQSKFVYDIEKFPVVPAKPKEIVDISEGKTEIKEVKNDIDTQLVDVIGAANASDTIKPAMSRFRKWFKEAFTFENSSSTDNRTIKKDEGEVSTSTVISQDNGGGNYVRLIISILLPTILLIGALYFLQKYIFERVSFFNERKTLYWMLGFILFAIVFAFLKMNATALVFLALFLISIAWYLFSSAMDDLDDDVTPEDVETITSDEDRM